ncbi:BRCT domain-containing protein [Halodesulfovibrio aestuarii]|uniref:BRCT domain-containing protein n=1 Tax=Halodesulfovibrio aestuarii TaxID=126333 RepID=A0ABV4JW83_9BACT
MSAEPIDMRFGAQWVEDRDSDELIGICKGILADGKVVEEEAKFLLKWLTTRKEYSSNWFTETLHDRLKEVFRDGVVDESEQLELFELLTQFVGNPNYMAEVNAIPTNLPVNDPAPEIDLRDKTFCFTGTFAFGNRKDCWAATEELGGIATNSVTLKLDYLVIGSIGTASWKHSTYGRKIEKAVGYREKTGLVIISEDHWAKLIVGD